MRVLLIEDDIHVAELLLRGFREQGIEISHETVGASGSVRAVVGTFDVVILDVMLPGTSGFDVCRHLRSANVDTPILMLTARDALDDRVNGLEAGADDYLTKPFAFREVVARVRALARRRPAFVPQLLSVADLEVDLSTRRVSRGGNAIDLTAKEFLMLEFFVLNQDRVVDRAAITAHVWDDNHDPFTNVLEVLVKRLRRKIDDAFEPKLIHTLRGAGYRFGI